MKKSSFKVDVKKVSSVTLVSIDTPQVSQYAETETDNMEEIIERKRIGTREI